MPNEARLDRNSSGELEFGGRERFISRLADRQHGVVTRTQLLDAAFSEDVIDYRLKLGRLLILHRGVYAAGHRRLTREGRLLAAVLAAGPSAVASHCAASALWGFWYSDRLEVTTPNYRVRPGIQIHTSPLQPDEVTSLQAIPVTGVSRTLLDLAVVLRPHQLERAMHEVEIQRLTDPLSLPDLLARYPGRRGVRTIRQILDAGAAPTRSELESRFLSFVRKTGLPLPATNVLVLGFECDCVWREQRVVVELDGRATHATSAAFERDRSRDRALQAAGWRVVRVTWRQLHEDVEALAADLRRIVRAQPPPRRARARGEAP
jgi:hypothetical protein